MNEMILGGTFTFPGTSSVDHLRENLAAAKLVLSPETLSKLDGIAATMVKLKH